MDVGSLIRLVNIRGYTFMWNIPHVRLNDNDIDHHVGEFSGMGLILRVIHGTSHDPTEWAQVYNNGRVGWVCGLTRFEEV